METGLKGWNNGLDWVKTMERMPWNGFAHYLSHYLLHWVLYWEN